MVSIVGASGRTPMLGRAPLAPTFRNDEVEAQFCSEQDRWTFYEFIIIDDLVKSLKSRHCEERSDEAI